MELVKGLPSLCVVRMQELSSRRDAVLHMRYHGEGVTMLKCDKRLQQ